MFLHRAAMRQRSIWSIPRHQIKTTWRTPCTLITSKQIKDFTHILILRFRIDLGPPLHRGRGLMNDTQNFLWDAEWQQIEHYNWFELKLLFCVLFILHSHVGSCRFQVRCALNRPQVNLIWNEVLHIWSLMLFWVTTTIRINFLFKLCGAQTLFQETTSACQMCCAAPDCGAVQRV